MYLDVCSAFKFIIIIDMMALRIKLFLHCLILVMGSNDNETKSLHVQIVQCNLQQWQQQQKQQNVQIMAINKNRQSKYRQDSNGMRMIQKTIRKEEDGKCSKSIQKNVLTFGQWTFSRLMKITQTNSEIHRSSCFSIFCSAIDKNDESSEMDLFLMFCTQFQWYPNSKYEYKSDQIYIDTAIALRN